MKQTRRRFFRAIALALGILVIVNLSRRVYSLWRRTDVVRERRVELQKVQEENRRLGEKLTEVQSPGFIEQQARDKLGLIKEGEMVVLIEVPEHASPEAMTEVGQSNQKLMWKTWWRLFY
jgi:cell division protein FtsB